MLIEDSKEVVGMLLPHILNTKVVDNEDKLDRAPYVVLEPRYGGQLVVVSGTQYINPWSFEWSYNQYKKTL